MWLSQPNPTDCRLEFDLGAVHELGSMLVWNYNERDHTQRGIRSADLSILTAEGDWKLIYDDYVFTEAEGSFDYDEPTHIQFDGVKAQKVRLEDLKSLGDQDYVGLSEVQFFKRPKENTPSKKMTIETKS
jgi:hypothetical protein